jgi:hypothetical protein
LLGIIEFVFTQSSSASTGMSPFKAIEGWNPLTSMTVDLKEVDSDVSAANNMIVKFVEAEDTAEDILKSKGYSVHSEKGCTLKIEKELWGKLEAVQSKYKKYVDKKKQATVFNKGDKVMVNTKEFDFH